MQWSRESSIVPQLVVRAVIVLDWHSIHLGSRSPLHTTVHCDGSTSGCKSTNRHDDPCIERILVQQRTTSNERQAAVAMKTDPTHFFFEDDGIGVVVRLRLDDELKKVPNTI